MISLTNLLLHTGKRLAIRVTLLALGLILGATHQLTAPEEVGLSPLNVAGEELVRNLGVELGGRGCAVGHGGEGDEGGDDELGELHFDAWV